MYYNYVIMVIDFLYISNCWGEFYLCCIGYWSQEGGKSEILITFVVFVPAFSF